MNIIFTLEDGEVGVEIDGEFHQADERFYLELDNERRVLKEQLELERLEVQRLKLKVQGYQGDEIELYKARSVIRMIEALVD